MWSRGLEFERLLSGSGPNGGHLRRPSDGRKVSKIAWLQCVGSRNLRTGNDFCSSVCCMISIKEALLAKERQGPGLETAIFYTDLRTAGKSFQRYRDRAADEHGVRFERCRVHTVDPDAATGRLNLRYLAVDGSCQQEQFDMVVLAVGQRPAAQTAALAEQLNLELNPWGFIQTQPFAATPDIPGRFAGGRCRRRSQRYRRHGGSCLGRRSERLPDDSRPRRQPGPGTDRTGSHPGCRT